MRVLSELVQAVIDLGAYGCWTLDEETEEAVARMRAALPELPDSHLLRWVELGRDLGHAYGVPPADVLHSVSCLASSRSSRSPSSSSPSTSSVSSG